MRTRGGAVVFPASSSPRASSSRASSADAPAAAADAPPTPLDLDPHSFEVRDATRRRRPSPSPRARSPPPLPRAKWAPARAPIAISAYLMTRSRVSASPQGSRLLAKLAMLVYWNAGQPGFWDPSYDGARLDLATPLGFEPLIARDPAALRAEFLSLGAPAEPALWLDPDPGVGPLTPTFKTAEEVRREREEGWSSSSASSANGGAAGVSRVAVVRLERPNWIVVCFRGTTPSPLRGLLREGQVNSMAGQEVWSEAPDALEGSRVHRGYASAYRTVLNDVEGAVAAWARKEAAASSSSSSSSTSSRSPPPRVVVVGHSLGGALATLCASRLVHDVDVLNLAGDENAVAVECVTFGQPKVGDSAFRARVDDDSPALRYTRVVREWDLFARVPTSGYWLPSGNAGRFEVDYAHAGALVWTRRDASELAHAAPGEEEPAGFNSGVGLLNPLGVARDHAGYASFFPDELREHWPSRDADARGR